MSASFLGSFVPGSDLPVRSEPRIAFLGRSNVGKSSLINLIAGTTIARVSKTPGRTQALNLYLIDGIRILGDFPGYGYAKVSKETRRELAKLIDFFLTKEIFQYAVQVVDARHPGLEADLQLHRWLRTADLPHLIVLTKADKLNRKERAEADRKAREAFSQQPLLFASSFTKEGKQELKKILQDIGGITGGSQ
jgi:GTP-binding protein